MSRRHGARFHRAPAHLRRDASRNATTDRPDAGRAVPPGTSADSATVGPTDLEPTDQTPRDELPVGSTNGFHHDPPAPVIATTPVRNPASEPARGGDRTDPSDRLADPAPPAPPTSTGCTAPQLRRFIKSRAYVPMHELRRRFGINGAEDDVTGVDAGGSRVFVGLPSREGELLGELFRAGDIGYELSVDPCTPVVVGVYPMRPVPRS